MHSIHCLLLNEPHVMLVLTTSNGCIVIRNIPVAIESCAGDGQRALLARQFRTLISSTTLYKDDEEAAIIWCGISVLLLRFLLWYLNKLIKLNRLTMFTIQLVNILKQQSKIKYYHRKIILISYGLYVLSHTKKLKCCLKIFDLDKSLNLNHTF